MTLLELGPDEWFMVVLATGIIFGIIGPKWLRERRKAAESDPS